MKYIPQITSRPAQCASFGEWTIFFYTDYSSNHWLTGEKLSCTVAVAGRGPLSRHCPILAVCLQLHHSLLVPKLPFMVLGQVAAQSAQSQPL